MQEEHLALVEALPALYDAERGGLSAPHSVGTGEDGAGRAGREAREGREVKQGTEGEVSFESSASSMGSDAGVEGGGSGLSDLIPEMEQWSNMVSAYHGISHVDYK